MGMTDNQFKSYRRQELNDFQEIKKALEINDLETAKEKIDVLIANAQNDIEA